MTVLEQIAIGLLVVLILAALGAAIIDSRR